MVSEVKEPIDRKPHLPGSIPMTHEGIEQRDDLVGLMIRLIRADRLMDIRMRAKGKRHT